MTIQLNARLVTYTPNAMIAVIQPVEDSCTSRHTVLLRPKHYSRRNIIDLKSHNHIFVEKISTVDPYKTITMYRLYI